MRATTSTGPVPGFARFADASESATSKQEAIGASLRVCVSALLLSLLVIAGRTEEFSTGGDTLPHVDAMTFPPRYQPVGQDSWDYWYAKRGNTFYAFYLQCPINAPVRFGPSCVGLATSQDQIHWTEYGEVLRANPPGMWNDAWIATGSVWWQVDHWRMLFTGQTYTGVRGFGMATSNDLMHWTRFGSGPVQMNYQPFIVPSSPYWQGRGFVAGTSLVHSMIADPYVLPEPIDGMLYMVGNSIFDLEPLPTRGCITLWRSHDGRVWDEVGVVAAPHIFDETEAPKIWKHGDRWYLVFGAARAQPFLRGTVVYTAPTIFGPFEPSPSPDLVLPDNPGWFYIAMVKPNAYGQDILLADVAGTLSHPYSIFYEPDGSLTLGPYDWSFSQWVPGGVPNLTGPIVSDGDGGVISNGRSRVNGNGNVMWGPTAASTATRWVGDGLGGSLGVVVQSNDVYGTRCSHQGATPWGQQTIACGTTGTQRNPVVAPDGAGGAFFAWTDPASSGNIFVQHLDSLGRATWTTNGVAVCTATGAQDFPQIIGDGGGGTIITWRDDRTGSGDIYAQRVNATGASVWAANGVAVCASSGIQDSPILEPDGAGGAYVAWTDARGGPRDVYMQRLSPSGAPYWAANGILVGGGANDQWHPTMAPDGAGGVYVAWQDHRAGGTAGMDIFAQRVDRTGALLWSATGVAVCAESHAQQLPSIVADRDGGVVVAWMDARDNTSATSTYYLPYAQRFDPGGAGRWSPDGVRVEVTGIGTTGPVAPSIASDLAGGIYLSGTSGLHRVLGDGRLGWMSTFTPRINGIHDVPNDPGGFVQIEFTGAYSELAPFAPSILSYEVWRKVVPPAPEFASPSSAGGLSRAGVDTQSLPRREALAGPPVGWELVTSVVPNGSIGYTVSAPTRADSSAVGRAAEEFVVAARTTGAGYVLPSESSIGYSVANVASLSFAPEPQRPIPPSNYLGHFAPNPLRTFGSVEYGLARGGPVSLEIFDAAGRRVRGLVRGAVEAGTWHAAWDARDDHGQPVRSGIYLVRFVGGGVERSAKVVVAQ